MILAARGHLRGVTYTHLETLLRFASQAQSGRILPLPGRLVARKEFEWLILGPQSPLVADGEFSYPVEVPGRLSVPQLGLSFRFEVVGLEETDEKAYNQVQTASLDLLKLPGKLRLRSWRAGDRFWPLGSRKLLRLKELFREHKIPLAQRKLWPVLESGQEIVWVRGFPPANLAAAMPDSKRILKIVEEVSR